MLFLNVLTLKLRIIIIIIIIIIILPIDRPEMIHPTARTTNN